MAESAPQAPPQPAEESADVAGMTIDSARAEPRPSRARVAVVMAGWATDWAERRAAIRMIAGAVALSADIVVVSLDDRTDPSRLPPRR
ncbi:MAG: hypothetical protein ACLPQS_16855, partial [Acidimicrobiales bacterium]